MLSRCRNPKAAGYRYWGGRGIRVCPRWRKSFVAFLADMGEPPPGRTTIDRIKNHLSYRPGNCRWATSKTQNNNSRRNHMLTFKGKTQSVALWAEEIGIRQRLLHARVTRLGWSVERALTERPNPRRQAAGLNHSS
jgi:hypothetical protein